MQVTNHSNNKRKMKEELLEAIYGTVERLEQKVDELSDSTKNAGTENDPASNDTTKLEKSIIARFADALDAQKIEQAARTGDTELLRQILTQVLSTDAGQRLAGKVKDAMQDG